MTSSSERREQYRDDERARAIVVRRRERDHRDALSGALRELVVEMAFVLRGIGVGGFGKAGGLVCAHDNTKSAGSQRRIGPIDTARTAALGYDSRMRIAEVVKLFAGSCLVYVVVAACSAYSGSDPAASSSSSSGGSNGDGSTSDTSIIDPVGNALAQGHKSGSRLKLRFYEGSDGSRQWINFFDSELQMECTVSDGQRTTDDKVRCLPAGGGNLIFSDTNCATPTAYAVSKTSAQPKVIRAEVILQSKNFVELYTLGALQAGPAGTVYIRSFEGTAGNGCGTITGITGADYNFYAVGAPMAPSAFVEMTIKTE